jgi:hypothetical protein
MEVAPYQRYAVRGTFRLDHLETGYYGLYAMAYSDPGAEGHFTVIPVERGPGPNAVWETLEGVVDVPEGTRSMRIMIWAEKQSVCTFAADRIEVSPVDD